MGSGEHGDMGTCTAGLWGWAGRRSVLANCTEVLFFLIYECFYAKDGGTLVASSVYFCDWRCLWGLFF